MKSRATAALVALLCVLFAQLAVAAYACPMPAQADCCMAMDESEPALCQAHCQQGDQSFDKPISAVALPMPAFQRVAAPQAAPPPPSHPPPRISRSVAVLHCRFLI